MHYMRAGALYLICILPATVLAITHKLSGRPILKPNLILEMASPHRDSDHDNHRHYAADDIDGARLQNVQDNERREENGDVGDPPEHVAPDTTDLDLILTYDEDEGCVLDMTEEARGYGQFPLTADDLPVPGAKYGGLTKGTLPDDSGFSSRVSEDSASLHRTVEIRELRKAVTEVAIEDDKGITEGCCSVRSVVRGIVKILGVFILLYIFICSLDLLSNAFRLLGGKTAGSVFQDNELLQNPITGLMIGVLSTVILQSSSTSTSIVITMVSSGILEVRPAIPIIMGANIGTTVTNTLVSLAHSMDPKEFRRAFSGATVHDVFNWLTVLILLPLEYACGYLYHLTSEIVKSLNMEQLRTKKQDLLKQLTKPLTSRIVQIDKKVITAIAEGKEGYDDARLLKIYCEFEKNETTSLVNTTLENGTFALMNQTNTVKVPVEECDTLLVKLGMGDMGSGLLLFSASVLILSVCLYFMVKLLHSILGGHVARMAKKTINANFPGPFSCLTDYVAILVGAGMTILVQSSSVFTSALTPLVGVGCLKLERMYPLTLGSNIGTTATGILAALASSSSTMQLALQLALCHLFFNISGILLFFPIPFMRRIPLRAARFLGRTTARYRWFAIFYLMLVFLVFPGCFLALSFAGKTVFLIAVALIGAVVLAIVIINVLQCSRFRSKLPTWLQTWEWLPLCLRSLQPLDRVFRAMCSPLSRICCACCVDKCRCLGEQNGEESVDSDTESEDDTDSESDDSEYSQTDASCCCCGRNRSMKLQQSDPAIVVDGELHHHHVWLKRTSTPIFKPSLKLGHSPSPSPSTVPLIKVPESVV